MNVGAQIPPNPPVFEFPQPPDEFAQDGGKFYRCYDVATNRIWTCMHRGEIIGSLCLMRRGDEAQLRYFFIRKPYRGIKLGRKLMMLFMDFLDCITAFWSRRSLGIQFDSCKFITLLCSHPTINSRSWGNGFFINRIVQLFKSFFKY